MAKVFRYSHLLILALASLFACPQSAVAGDVHVTSRTVFDTDEILRRDFTFATRQRFSQLLGLRAADLLDSEHQGLSIQFQLRVDTDFQRRFREIATDPRDQEAADVVLQFAHIEYQPIDELTVRAGRQVLYGALHPVDVDGVRIFFSGGRGFRADAAAGREVRYDLPGIDAALFDRPAPPWLYFEQPDQETLWLTDLAMGWVSRPLQVRLGHRLGIEQGELETHHTGVVAQTQAGPFRATARATVNHVVFSPERLEVAVGVRLPEPGVNASVVWRYLRPTFDWSSIFNVFPVTPSVGWRAHITANPHSSWGLSTSAQLRAFGLDEETPWSGGLAGDAHRRAGMGRVGAHYLPLTQLRLSLDGGVEGGYGGLLVDGDAAIQWTAIPERLVMGLRWRQAYRRDEGEGGQQGHIASGSWRGEYQLADFGSLVVAAEYLADYRYTARFRLIACLDFDLEVF